MNKEEIKKIYRKCKSPRAFYATYCCTEGKCADNPEEYFICVEEMNLLGALYIAIVFKKIQNLGIEKYIQNFIERHKDNLKNEICKNVKEYIKLLNKKRNENTNELEYENTIIELMQILYLCAMYLDKESREKFFEEVLYYDKSNKNLIDYIYAKGIAKALSEKIIADIQWKEKYCEVLMSINKAIASINKTIEENIKFLDSVEFYLRKNQFGYHIPDEAAKEYFEFLCNNKKYNAARYFVKNFDEKKGFPGMKIEDFKNKLYLLPDPGLITYAKENCLTNDKQDKWEEILKQNTDEDCQKWIKLVILFSKLQENVKEENWEDFENNLVNIKNYEMFNLDKITYFKPLIISLADIVNIMIDKKPESLVNFLEKIEIVNINAFTNAKYVFGINQRKEIINTTDCRQIKKILFKQFKYEEIVYIYMNTHLKSLICIEDIILRASQTPESVDFRKIFKNYKISGKISIDFGAGAVRDKFFIMPNGILKRYTFTGYICAKRLPEYKKMLIRCKDKWYGKNKYEAELIKNMDNCTFVIDSYSDNKGIFATDIMLPDDIKNQRIRERNEQYPKEIKKFLKKIKKDKGIQYDEDQNIKAWEKQMPVYEVKYISDINERIDIAIEVLNIIDEIKDNISELEKFVSIISKPPYEAINEFRFYAKQKELPFQIPRNRFHDIIEFCIEKGNTILGDEHIPKDLRKEIYLNTMLRKFYDLKNVCENIGEEFYKETAEDPFVVSLTYQGKNEFSTRRKKEHNNKKRDDSLNNVIFSNTIFKYKTNTTLRELEENEDYYVELDKYSKKDDCFYLSNVNLKENELEPWKKFLRTIFDLKKAYGPDDRENIKKKLERYQFKKTPNKISQFSHELLLVFDNKKFDIDEAINALDTIGEKNLLICMEGEKINLSELVNELEKSSNNDFYYKKLKEDYKDAYKNFLENFITNKKSALMFCDLYFKTFLRIVIKEEDFFNDIEANDEIMRYCEKKFVLKNK